MEKETAIGFYRAAWLVIASTGGWWTPKEIFEKLNPDICIAEAHTALWIMANRYGLLERRGELRKPEYAVTQKCKVPRGISVGEILEMFK